MAAKGTESKNTIFTKLQEVYPEAFWEDTGKILRIPLIENGESVEIKVSLTAAKTNLRNDAGAFATSAPEISIPEPAAALEPTEEEKENVRNLLNALNF